MDIGTLIIVCTLVLAVLMIFLQKKKPSESKEKIELLEKENEELKKTISEKNQEIGTLKAEVKEISEENIKIKGKFEQLEKTNEHLNTENERLNAKAEELNKTISNYENTEKQRKKESDNIVAELTKARDEFNKEKERVKSEESERKRQEEEERDRLWAEHENLVKANLAELCKKPEFSFQSYDNTNLPEDLDSKIEPDFMINFLDEYVVFDAKKSKSNNLQNYISNQVKDTVQKYKKSSKIHKTIFFVIPTEAMKVLKKNYFYEQGYTFYVIPPEACVVILACLKKITAYEITEHLDPAKRENLITLIAELDHYITFRSSTDILLAKSGINVQKHAKQLCPDFEEEIDYKKKSKRLVGLNMAEIKRLMTDTQTQENEINKLTSPKSEVETNDINNASAILLESQNKNDA